MAHSSLWTWLLTPLGDLFRRPVEEEAPAAPPPPPALGSTLADLSRSLDLLRGADVREDVHETESQRDARQKAEREEAERLEAEGHRQVMRDEILALHRHLGTGVDTAELDRLHDAMAGYLQELKARLDQAGLEAGVLGAVASGLYRRAGEEAWTDLLRRLAAAGESWPEPLGLPPRLEPEEAERARALQMGREKADFLASSAPESLDRMRGVVQVWRAAYPERGSSLWRSTCLRGVGAGLRMRLLERAFLAARDAGPKLSEKLQVQLQARLQEVQALLGQGVTSLDEADRIARETDRICRETAPAVVWDELKDRILGEPVA